jgi:hypothetical protein
MTFYFTMQTTPTNINSVESCGCYIAKSLPYFQELKETMFMEVGGVAVGAFEFPFHTPSEEPDVVYEGVRSTM